MRNFHRHKIHEKEKSDHRSSHSFDKFFIDSRDGRARDSVSGFLLVLKENKRKATARQVRSHRVASNIRHESDRPDEADWEGTRNSRCVSSSCKIKLNKHDCRAGERENVLGGKPKQAKRRAFSHVRRSAVTSHPFFSTLWGNVLCVRWVDFSFSARSGYQFSLSRCIFSTSLEPRAFPASVILLLLLPLFPRDTRKHFPLVRPEYLRSTLDNPEVCKQAFLA